jgi:hypothetical protein
MTSHTRADSVINTLVILFLIAVSPFILAMAVMVGWLWLGMIWHG